MLGHLFATKEHQPHVVEVDGDGDALMRFDHLPGLFHATAPMDVVEHEHRIVMGLGKALLEVFQGGLLGVMSVNEGQIEALHAAQHFGQSCAETAQHRLDVPLFQLFEVVLRDPAGLRAAFNGGHLPLFCAFGEVQRADAEGGAQFEHVLRLEVAGKAEQQLGLPWRFHGRTGDVRNTTCRQVEYARTGAEIVHTDGLLTMQQVFTQLLHGRELRQLVAGAEHLRNEVVNERAVHTVPRACLYQVAQVTAQLSDLIAHCGHGQK